MSVIQPQSIQLRRSCPGDCHAAGKERSLSAPPLLVWPVLQLWLSHPFGVSSRGDRFMLSRCAQHDGVGSELSRCVQQESELWPRRGPVSTAPEIRIEEEEKDIYLSKGLNKKEYVQRGSS